MAYNVLAINPGHNGSAALVSDGNIIFYSEEERFTRFKYDGNPFRAMIYIMVNFPVNEVVIGGTYIDYSKLVWTNEDAYAALARKFNPGVKITYMGHLHHLGHAASAFYGSGFETAAAVVVDGAGSYHKEQLDNEGLQFISGFETESVYYCQYPYKFEAVYKKYSDNDFKYYENGIQEFDDSVSITKAYEAVTDYLGFHFIDAGKTMGLSSYGTDDEDIPDIFVDGKGNKNLLIPRYPAGASINEHRYPYLRRFMSPVEWHKEPSMIRDVDKNLAYKVQKQAEEQMFSLIQKAIDLTGEENIVISGGFGLNCVANYKYLKEFPNINFFIDPIAHDGGTSIGLAQLGWRQFSKSTDIIPYTSLYLGPPQDYSNLEVLHQQIENLTIQDANITEVANLIKDGNIVGLFQGRAEGGPRALGNRSILFDPTNPDGKDIVNSVKKREWFRPFAGSILEEHAKEWFDMDRLEKSPFMMYAVNVLDDKKDLIPAVTHVDGTCRVQTVSKEENETFYNLIEAFYQLSGIPILFNTSFNLAGDPLAETVVDAIVTMFNSNLEYVYLADINKLLIKTVKLGE